MLDVLLINPPYSFTDLVKLRKKKNSRGFYLNYPHLGLGYVAASTRKAGYSVEIIDASANLSNESDIVKIIRRKKPKIVGLTMTTQTSQGVYSLVKRIKAIYEPPIVVVGGPQVSAIPESIKWLNVPYGIVGEGEYAFVKLLDYLIRRKGFLHKIKGAVYIKQGKIKINPNPPIKNLNDLTFPARDLMPTDAYFSPVKSGKITSMITARGCPFNCTYCSRPAIGRLYRYRSPRNIVKEMKEVVKKYGVLYIEFVDDTLTLDKKRIYNLCKLIKSEKINVSWGCQTRADMVDFRLLKKMKNAGCEKISFGLETGVESIRFNLNKRIPDEYYVKAVAWCHKLEIETNLFVMFGHPGEKLKDMEKSIRFTISLAPDYAAFYITTIVPGSLLEQRAIKEGRIKRTVWREYMYKKAKLPAYVPDGIKMEELEKIHRKAFRKFYVRPSYIIGRIRKIDSLPYLLTTLKSGFAVVNDYITPLEL